MHTFESEYFNQSAAYLAIMAMRAEKYRDRDESGLTAVRWQRTARASWPLGSVISLRDICGMSRVRNLDTIRSPYPNAGRYKLTKASL